MKIEKLLTKIKDLPERPDFHPERTTGKHTLLVALKALLATNNMDLVLAGLFHDVHKGTSGQMVKTENFSYWSNPEHAKQAFEDDNIRYAVKQFGGNWDVVGPIILEHMNAKNGNTKASKKVKHIDTFVSLDDMIFRKKFPALRTKIFVPNVGTVKGSLFFVGQSPIQQWAQNGQFTVTINRCPLTFSIEAIPSFFVGRFEEIGKLLLKLK